MNYNFDNITNRRNTNSLKWDVAENELPMWVADMDFETAPEVTKVIVERAKQGIFGYEIVPDEWYKAIISWWDKRHDFTIAKDWLIFCTGVVPAITCLVKRLTNIGDNVLVQTPVYDIFFHSIENTGRHVLENELVYDGENYQIDFCDLEEKLAHPQTKLMILCNPHNPVGKVWSSAELKKIGALCKKYNVVVISDEIHCEITKKGRDYTPFAAVSDECKENSITCISASKAFNLAGMQSAAVFVPNKALYEVVNRGLNSDEIAEPNSFAVSAVIAAFTKGEKWLEELREYLFINKKTASDYIADNIPLLKVTPSDATYLLWVDCSKITQDTEVFCEFLRSKHGLFISGGAQYRGNGKTFIRINLACAKSQMEEGLRRMKTGVEEFEKL